VERVGLGSGLERPTGAWATAGEPVWSGGERTLYRQPLGQQPAAHIQCVAAGRGDMGSAERTVLMTSSLRGAGRVAARLRVP
jgi:hypothetical protein